MDETYISVKGKWYYLYRAVDKSGITTDFMLSQNRDELAAKCFFNKAIARSGKTEKITIDKSGVNNTALKSINKTLTPLEQIEIRHTDWSELHHMLRKNQYNVAANLTLFEQFYALAA